MISRQMKYKNANRERVRVAEALAARKRRAANPEKYRQQSRAWRGIPEPTRPMPAVCECCGGLPKGKHKTLVVDHDHETGVFRGWLCDICNRAIGMLGDSVAATKRAVAYLERA
jgi:hypothetical protein